MAIIKLKLKEKLESSSDPELSTPPLQLQVAERFIYNESTGTSTNSESLNDNKTMHRKDHFFDQNVQLKLWNNAGKQSKNTGYGNYSYKIKLIH